MTEIVIRELGGQCPVQGNGTIGGIEFYFRARGEWWTLGIGGDPVLEPDWYHEEQYSNFDKTNDPHDMFAAGHMLYEEAAGFLFKAIRLYLEHRS